MQIHFISVVEDGKPLRVSININCNYYSVYFYFSDLDDFVNFTLEHRTELANSSLSVTTVDIIPRDCCNPFYLLSLLNH